MTYGPSDTPRTNAQIGRVHLTEGRNMVTADFARELERRLERMHSLLGLLADRFHGYLPWPDELRSATVRGHEAAIADTIKKADALMEFENLS